MTKFFIETSDYFDYLSGKNHIKYKLILPEIYKKRRDVTLHKAPTRLIRNRSVSYEELECYLSMCHIKYFLLFSWRRHRNRLLESSFLDVRLSFLLSVFLIALYRGNSRLTFDEISHLNCLHASGWSLLFWTESVQALQQNTMNNISCYVPSICTFS